MTFEQQLAQSMFQHDKEKTYVDKILDKSDIEKIKDLIKLPILTRENLLELSNMLTSAELKLVYFDENERYVLGKYYIWVCNFVELYELLFDYKDFLEKRKITLADREDALFKNTMKILDHSVKMLCNIFVYIVRSSLSLGAKGFQELLTNKFELQYDSKNVYTPVEREKKKVFGLFGGGKKND